MLDTPCFEVVSGVLGTHSIRQFSLHFPSRASPCAITFQLDYTALNASVDFSDIYLLLKIRKIQYCSIKIAGNPRLTNRIPSAHLVLSRKQEMGWNILPPAQVESDAPIRRFASNERSDNEQFEMYFGLKFSSGNFGRTVGWSPLGWPQVGEQLW